VQKRTHFTGPISLSLAFVSGVSGVEAITHTPPSVIRIAVERPPTGIIPKRANGLILSMSERACEALTRRTLRRSRHPSQPNETRVSTQHRAR
jgi:hypothetical protein